MENYPLVSVIIPGRNSGKHLENCFKYLKAQTYPNLEIIVADSNSQDNTEEICRNYQVKLIQFDNSFLKGRFDATYKRNSGAKEARGEFIYYLDADFELTKDVIKEAVESCTKEGYDAVIVKENVVGKGFWTYCKAMEQECYWGDDNVEAPRFFRKTVWQRLNGLDSTLGAGCDDWDLYQRLLESGYKAKRINAPLVHNEGKITITGSAKKAFMYGKDVSKFVKKSPKKGFIYFFPIRPAYIRNWKLFLMHPGLGGGIIIMRLVEYIFGAFGVIANKFLKNNETILAK